MKHRKPYGAGRNAVMKKLVAFGLLVATVAFAGTAFADDGTLQDRELQKLFEWSAQVASPMVYTAGPGTRSISQVPPVLEYRGSDVK
jgi:hypothetical protein